ncbi:MAG: hypothetical protein ACKOWF_03570, partial [Chloroflexota bacterium]
LVDHQVRAGVKDATFAADGDQAVDEGRAVQACSPGAEAVDLPVSIGPNGGEGKRPWDTRRSSAARSRQEDGSK